MLFQFYSAYGTQTNVTARTTAARTWMLAFNHLENRDKFEVLFKAAIKNCIRIFFKATEAEQDNLDPELYKDAHQRVITGFNTLSQDQYNDNDQTMWVTINIRTFSSQVHRRNFPNQEPRYLEKPFWENYAINEEQLNSGRFEDEDGETVAWEGLKEALNLYLEKHWDKDSVSTLAIHWLKNERNQDSWKTFSSQWQTNEELKHHAQKYGIESVDTMKHLWKELFYLSILKHFNREHELPSELVLFIYGEFCLSKVMLWFFDEEINSLVPEQGHMTLLMTAIRERYQNTPFPVIKVKRQPIPHRGWFFNDDSSEESESEDEQPPIQRAKRAANWHVEAAAKKASKIKK